MSLNKHVAGEAISEKVQQAVRFSPDLSVVPLAACRFGAGELAFGDNGEEAKTAPVTIIARTGKPVEHWFWGRIVHDLAGMKLPKPRLPLDYVHDPAEILGFLNHFDVTSGDLVVSGAVVPYKDSDRATEILHKSRAGVPYEASINFGGDGIRIEEVPAGRSSRVNGFDFVGPGIIVREWPLRGVAICPYGADMRTSVEFGEQTQVPILLVKGTTEMAEKTVAAPEGAVAPVESARVAPAEPAAQLAAGVEAQTQGEAAPAANPADKPVAQAVEPEKAQAPDARAELKRFMEAFGDARGAQWYAEGKTYPQAQELYVAAFRAENEALRARLKAAGAEMGEQKPVTFSPADDDPQRKRVAELTAKGVSPNRARFMAGISLPAEE